MAQLLLINPTRKGKRMAKHRTAAQKRATKKLIAFNRSRARHHTKKPTHRRKKNTFTGHHAAHSAAARKGWRHRRHNPIVHHRRHYRRRHNPTGLMGLVTSSLMPSIVGAAGGLGVDIAMKYIPFIPDTLKTGPVKNLTNAGVGVLLGVLAQMVGPLRKYAPGIVQGAFTINIYDAAKGMLVKQFPTLAMYEDNSMMGLGMYENEMMGLGQDDYGSLGQNDYGSLGIGEYDYGSLGAGNSLTDQLEL